MPSYSGGHPQTLEEVINTVLVTGEPAVVIPSCFLGELDAIVDEAKSRGMKLANVPKGGVTILPPIPVTDSELLNLCLSYCRSRTEEKHLTLFSGLDMDKLMEKTTSSTLPCRRLYHPLNYVFRIVYLCTELITVSDEEYRKAYEIVPILHVRPVQGVCEELRAMYRSGALRLNVGAVSPSVTNYSDVKLSNVASPANSHEPHTVNVDTSDLHDSGENQSIQSESYSDYNIEVVDSPVGAVPEYLCEKDFEIVENTCSVLDPSGKRILAVYIRGGLQKHLCRRVAASLEAAATKRNMRKATNGGVTNPDTGIVGYYDYLNNPHKQKCRETEFTRSNWDAISKPCADFLMPLDKLYKEHAPLNYKLQSKAIPASYRLAGTVFSTITVNKNFRTAVHRDAGDFRDGLAAVCVVDGKFEGCHLAIKGLRKAFRLQVGDVLFFDSSLEHGNTEVHSPDGRWKRISVVCYLRCGLMSYLCELERLRTIRAELMNQRVLGKGRSAINMNGGDPTLPPLYVPAELAKMLSLAQHTALGFITRRVNDGNGCIVAMTMGLGKTLVSLAMCYSYIHQHAPCDILIVVPKILLSHWLSEKAKWELHGLVFPKFVIYSGGDSSALNDTSKTYRRQQAPCLKRVSYIFVINPGSMKSFLAKVSGFQPSLIIIDEGHCISSKASKLRDSLDRLNCPRRVILSGTPMQNNTEELYRLVGWVDKDVHSMLPQREFNDLSNNIRRYVNGDGAFLDAAVHAQRYIQEWMSPYVFTVLKTDLPPLHDYIIVCSYSRMQKTLYADYIQSNQEEAPLCLRACEHRPYHLSTHPLCFLGFIIGAYNSMKDLPCSHSEIHFNEVDLRQLTYEEFLLVDRCLNLLNEHKLLDFVGLSCKLSALLSILYSINKRGEKAVIFSQYVGSQDFIFRILEACQIHTVVIRGKDCAERRQRVMELFKNDSEISCLVLSTQIGAHGLDISVANHVILWDSWWNPQVETQAIARCYRRNQCKPVVAYKLVSEYDDAIVLKTQFRKRALFKCVIGGETSQVADESELADCTNTEEDSERRALWIALKSSTAEGGGPTVTKIIRNVDTVRSERWI